MPDPFVSLPYAAYGVIPDRNLLSSDSCHFVNGSGGDWTGGAVATRAPAWSGKSYAMTTQEGSPSVFTGLILSGDIAGGETLMMSGEILQITDPSEQRYGLFTVREFDAASVSLGFTHGAATELTVGVPVRVSVPITLQALTRKLMLYLYLKGPASATPPAGEDYEIYDLMLTEGTSTVFGPSLDCDTLFEVKDPAGLTAVHTKGTDLRVGGAWAGDAVKYQRFDGADADGLLVAEFDGADVLDAV